MKSTSKVTKRLPGAGLILLLVFTLVGLFPALVSPAKAQDLAFVMDRGGGGVARTPSVAVVDTTTLQILQQIDLEAIARPSTLALTPDGRLLYVPVPSENEIKVFDVGSRSVVQTITVAEGVGDGPKGIVITPDGKFAYVAHRREATVRVLDLSTNTFITTITSPFIDTPQEVAITPDGSHVYVANIAFRGNPVFGSAPENVTVIETATNTVVAGVDVSLLVTQFGPWGVTALPDGKKVYSNDGAEGEFVFEIDSDSTSATFNQVTAVIPVGLPGDSVNGPRGMESGVTPVGVRVYAALATSDEVVVINPATNNVVARVQTGVFSLPMRVRLNPLGTQLWVSLQNSNEVLVLDTEKIEIDPVNAQIARITGFNEPAQIAFTPLPHFQCYRVEKEISTKLAVSPVVKLEDQFGVKENVKVADTPDFLCNPVVKNNEGNFVNPTNHLACYKITGTKANLDVDISNQFGAQTLRLKGSKLLCVPSTKEVVLP